MIITGRMPAEMQVSTASRASLRGGSIMPTSPEKTNPSSQPLESPSSRGSPMSLNASPRTLIPRCAMRAFAISMRSLTDGSSGTALSPSQEAVQAGRIESTAPLVKATKSHCGST